VKYIKFVKADPGADLTHQGFLLQVTQAAEFGSGKKGVALMELAIEVRKIIRDTAVKSFERGYWEFETEHAEAIKVGIQAIAWNPAAAEQMIDFAKASSELLDKPPVDDKKPEEKSAETAAQPS